MKSLITACMKAPAKFNKVIFCPGTMTATLALLSLAIKIFYLDSPATEALNIGLTGVCIISVLIMVAQYFEIRMKIEPGENQGF